MVPAAETAGSRPDKIVGGKVIVGRVGYNATPSIAARTPFQSAHQPQLQPVPAMFLQHTDTAEIAGIAHVN